MRDEVIDLPHRASRESVHDIFAYIGIERLEKALSKVKKTGTYYTNLAELYSHILRDNLEKENSDRMSAYYNLLPKLDEYKKSFNKAID